jgi:hypothetical protein
MSRLQVLFGTLIFSQAAHSTEEYVGRLWVSFPPARFVSGLISEDLERGFLVANLTLLAFGFSCWLWPVRRGWPPAPLAVVDLQRVYLTQEVACEQRTVEVDHQFRWVGVWPSPNAKC